MPVVRRAPNFFSRNAAIYGVENRIEFILGDAMKVLPTLKADAVFLSPPWGGPEYQNIEVFDLHSMIPPPLSALDMFRAARAVTPNVVFFLPRNIDTAQIAGLPAAAAAADTAAADSARNTRPSQCSGLPAVAAAPAGALAAGTDTALESTARVGGEGGVGGVALPKSVHAAQITGLPAVAAATATAGGLETDKSAAVESTTEVGGVRGVSRVGETREVEKDGVENVARKESMAEEGGVVGSVEGFDETCEVEMQFLNGKLKTTTAYFGVDIAAVGKTKGAKVSDQGQTEFGGSNSRDPSLALDIASFQNSSREGDIASSKSYMDGGGVAMRSDINSVKDSSRGGDTVGKGGDGAATGGVGAKEVSAGKFAWSGRHVRFSDDADDKVGVDPEVDWTAPTSSGSTPGLPCPPSQTRETRENALYEAWIG